MPRLPKLNDPFELHWLSNLGQVGTNKEISLPSTASKLMIQYANLQNDMNGINYEQELTYGQNSYLQNACWLYYYTHYTCTCFT